VHPLKFSNSLNVPESCVQNYIVLSLDEDLLTDYLVRFFLPTFPNRYLFPFLQIYSRHSSRCFLSGLLAQIKLYLSLKQDGVGMHIKGKGLKRNELETEMEATS
jgi:hypothetical protein